jgi:DNA-binding transcriptional MocR family regulator
MDSEGIRPDALRAACRDGRAKALYCQPVLQNPTGRTVTPRRRDELAQIVGRSKLVVVEDDTYGFLAPAAPRLAAVLPDAVWLTGTSKSLLPALRVGFLRAPAALLPRLEAAIGATVFFAPTLAAEAVARWLEDGTYERVVGWKRGEIVARRAIADRALAGFVSPAAPTSPHLFLDLPKAWTTAELCTAAERRGVLVTPAEAFAVALPPPSAVRLCLGPPATRGALEAALTRLAAVLSELPSPAHVVA